MDNKIEIIPDGVRGSKQRVRIDFDACISRELRKH